MPNSKLVLIAVPDVSFSEPFPLSAQSSFHEFSTQPLVALDVTVVYLATLSGFLELA